jgi:hypothetical protein
MYKYLALLSLSVLLSNKISAQTVENIVAEQKGNSIEITYDLSSTTKGQKFTLELFSSKDNFKFPLQYVTGDAGSEIQDGKAKKIYWDISREVGAFKGDLTFELHATLTFTPLTLLAPPDGKLFRRTNVYQLKWSGLQENPYLVEILKGGNAIGKIGEPTSPIIAWKVPADYKPGDDYTLKITDKKNSVSLNKTISIRRKFPLVLKIAIPVAVIAAGVTGAIIATHGSSSNGGTPGNTDLVGPPGTPPNP